MPIHGLGTPTSWANQKSYDTGVISMLGQIWRTLTLRMTHRTLLSGLERVMNSIKNGLGMRKTEIAWEPSRPRNPHFYAIFAQVHNTL